VRIESETSAWNIQISPIFSRAANRQSLIFTNVKDIKSFDLSRGRRFSIVTNKIDLNFQQFAHRLMRSSFLLADTLCKNARRAQSKRWHEVQFRVNDG
jgi:hypothetical protein